MQRASIIIQARPFAVPAADSAPGERVIDRGEDV
jgi:hypothetical protein